MQAMLDDLGLPLQGRRLSGCDDTLNYLTILKEIALRGYVLDNNSSLFDAAELRKLELFLYQSTCGNCTISSQCGNSRIFLSRLFTFLDTISKLGLPMDQFEIFYEENNWSGDEKPTSHVEFV